LHTTLALLPLTYVSRQQVDADVDVDVTLTAGKVPSCVTVLVCLPAPVQSIAEAICHVDLAFERGQRPMHPGLRVPSPKSKIQCRAGMFLCANCSRTSRLQHFARLAWQKVPFCLHELTSNCAETSAFQLSDMLIRSPHCSIAYFALACMIVRALIDQADKVCLLIAYDVGSCELTFPCGFKHGDCIV